MNDWACLEPEKPNQASDRWQGRCRTTDLEWLSIKKVALNVNGDQRAAIVLWRGVVLSHIGCL